MKGRLDSRDEADVIVPMTTNQQTIQPFFPSWSECAWIDFLCADKNDHKALSAWLQKVFHPEISSLSHFLCFVGRLKFGVVRASVSQNDKNYDLQICRISNSLRCHEYRE